MATSIQCLSERLIFDLSFLFILFTSSSPEVALAMDVDLASESQRSKINFVSNQAHAALLASGTSILTPRQKPAMSDRPGAGFVGSTGLGWFGGAGTLLAPVPDPVPDPVPTLVGGAQSIGDSKSASI